MYKRWDIVPVGVRHYRHVQFFVCPPFSSIFLGHCILIHRHVEQHGYKFATKKDWGRQLTWPPETSPIAIYELLTRVNKNIQIAVCMHSINEVHLNSSGSKECIWVDFHLHFVPWLQVQATSEIGEESGIFYGRIAWRREKIWFDQLIQSNCNCTIFMSGQIMQFGFALLPLIWVANGLCDNHETYDDDQISHCETIVRIDWNKIICWTHSQHGTASLIRLRSEFESSHTQRSENLLESQQSNNYVLSIAITNIMPHWIIHGHKYVRQCSYTFLIKLSNHMKRYIDRRWLTCISISNLWFMTVCFVAIDFFLQMNV